MIKLLLLLVTWFLFLLGTNMTEPGKCDFMHSITEAITKRVTKGSRSFEEYCQKKERVGWVMLIMAIILFLAIMAA